MVIAMFFGLCLQIASLEAQEPGEEGESKKTPPLAEIVRAHRDAIASSGRAETTEAELEVRVVFFPDARNWQLLHAYLEGVEKEEGPKELEKRLAAARKKWKRAKGRPGFEITLTQTAERAEKRSEARSLHLFPGDPKKMLEAKLGKNAIPWSPLGPPDGIARARVRVAMYETMKGGRLVPFIRELEPKGARLIVEGEPGKLIGAFPKALAKKKADKILLRLPSFDRFHGVSPEPHLLDLNDSESVFDRELSIKLERHWPPPWPPFPAALAPILGEDPGNQSTTAQEERP